MDFNHHRGYIFGRLKTENVPHVATLKQRGEKTSFHDGYYFKQCFEIPIKALDMIPDEAVPVVDSGLVR